VECPGSWKECVRRLKLYRCDAVDCGGKKASNMWFENVEVLVLDWIVQCFTSPPTQYRLYGRRFLQVKRPNQQYQITEGESCKGKQPKKHKENTNYTYSYTHKIADKYSVQLQHSKSPSLIITGWLGDGSHRGQGCQAWTVVGLPPRYPLEVLVKSDCRWATVIHLKFWQLSLCKRDLTATLTKQTLNKCIEKTVRL